MMRRMLLGLVSVVILSSSFAQTSSNTVSDFLNTADDSSAVVSTPTAPKVAPIPVSAPSTPNPALISAPIQKPSPKVAVTKPIATPPITVPKNKSSSVIPAKTATPHTLAVINTPPAAPPATPAITNNASSEILQALKELRDQNAHLMARVNTLTQQLDTLSQTVNKAEQPLMIGHLENKTTKIDKPQYKNEIAFNTQPPATKVTTTTTATTTPAPAATTNSAFQALGISQPAAATPATKPLSVTPTRHTTVQTQAATTTPAHVSTTPATAITKTSTPAKTVPNIPAPNTTAPATSATENAPPRILPYPPSPQPTAAPKAPPVMQPAAPKTAEPVLQTPQPTQPVAQPAAHSSLLGWAIALITAAMGLLVWLFWPKEEGEVAEKPQQKIAPPPAATTAPEPETAEITPEYVKEESESEFWSTYTDDSQEAKAAEAPPAEPAPAAAPEPTVIAQPVAPEPISQPAPPPQKKAAARKPKPIAETPREAPAAPVAAEAVHEEEETHETPEEPAAETSAEEHNEEYDFMDAEEAIAVKLDLARAYLEMGDYADVEFTLQSVLKSGSESQKQEAQLLLEQAKLAQSQ